MNNIIHINNVPVTIKKNTGTILQQCEQNQISIPRFCYHRQLSIAGNCRVCMVEIKNSVKPVISCATNISNNMHIFTNSDLVKIARENVLEFILINHPLDCPICDQAGECDLQDQTMVFGSDRGRYYQNKRAVSDKNFTPVISSIMTRCIHCTRCVRFSEEIAAMFFFGTMGRGTDTEISAYQNQTKFISEISGNVVDICPVGALTSKPYAFTARSWELYSISSIDIFDNLCSNIRVDVKNNTIMRILPKRNDYLNTEWISDKIRFSYENLMLNRLFYPVTTKNNISIITSWQYFYKQITKLLLLGIVEKKMCVNLDIFHDLSTLYNIAQFTNTVNALNYLYNKNKQIKYNSNLRNNWLYVDTVSKILQTEILIVEQLDLKLENTVLNALIYNDCYLNNKFIFQIGTLLNKHAFIIQIGVSNYTTYLFTIGKHFFCNKLTKKKNITHLTNKAKAPNYITGNTNFIYNVNNSVLLPGITNSLELSVCSTTNTYKKNITNYYVINCNNNVDLSQNKLLINLQTNQIEKKKYLFHIPIANIFEDIGYYLNMFGKKQTANPAISVTNNIISMHQFFLNLNKLVCFTSKAINNSKIILGLAKKPYLFTITNNRYEYTNNSVCVQYKTNYKLSNAATYYSGNIYNERSITLLEIYKLHTNIINY